MMTSLPVEVLLGIYLGLLTGIVPAFVAGSLGFVVRYFTGVTLPGLGVVVLALSIASVQGGLLGLVEPDIAQSPRLLVAVLVVLMLALYAHSQGDKLGANLPRRLSFSSLRQRTLSADVIEFVGAVGQVTVRPTGEIQDIEGYPPLSADLRSTLKHGSWRLPADLPLGELESRLAEQLRTEHNLADVSVSIDEHARATIAAAPPTSGLSRRVSEGARAVTLETAVPTGLARGDDVLIQLPDTSVSATVLSVRSELDKTRDEATATAAVGDETTPTTAPQTATAGGVGRVTVAVPRRATREVLSATSVQLVVTARATSDVFEAFSVIKRAGYAIRRVTVGSDAADHSRRRHRPEDADVTVLAVRRAAAESGGSRHGWVFGPGIERSLEAGDEAFLAGRESDLERFTEAIR